MKNKKRMCLASLAFGLCAGFLPLNLEAVAPQVLDLKCEYATNPIGMDLTSPQLSWRLESEERNVHQSAYQIIVSKPGAEHAEEVWNSGKVASQQSAGVLYAGAPLQSRQHYDWKVKVWNQEGEESQWSEGAFFEMGLMDESDWRSQWIAYAPGDPGRINYFKGTFTTQKEIAQARLYISGLGFYEVSINNRKVGDHVLDPAQSTYNKRIYYATYDVKDYLSTQNVFLVAVAPGWYGSPRLRFQMEIAYTDGSHDYLHEWAVRAVTTGPTVYSSLFDGECYDARLEAPALYQAGVPAGLMNKEWGYAHVADSPGGKMVSQKVEPIKVVKTLTPSRITEPKPGVYVFDTEQNLAGWASLSAQGQPGQVITLKFAESLYKEGLVNQENLRYAKATDTFILKGKGVETWEPRFTYHGFRYVQVEGLTQKPQVGDLQVKVIRNAVEETGSFQCSNELLNRIHKMVVATEASNLHSVPTDCPQRDERMGWLNDLTVRIEQALYNFDLSRFYPKFIADVHDTQDAAGTITCTAPFRFGARPADPVSASYLLLAWKSYEFYGDMNVIREHYEGMKAWVNYLNSRTENGIVNYSYYGDWSCPIAYAVNETSAVSRDTPGKLMSTGYLYYCASMISEMAKLLDRPQDVAHYSELATKTAQAFNREYWNEEMGGYAANNQAANSFALFLKIVPEDKVKRVVQNLAADVAKHDFHLTTGNLCTKYLLETLTEYGEVETAYKIATQTTYPSWGYMLANGATTLWERWEYGTGDAMNSHNHPMMGSVDSWFYKYLLGIKPDVKHPGFEQFTLRPYIVKDLQHAQGQFQTVKGLIRSAWEKKEGLLTWNVSVPANSTALLYVPTSDVSTLTEGGKKIEDVGSLKILSQESDACVIQAGSGNYHFQSAWTK